MTVYPSVVVPAIPPRPPQLSLMLSAIRPDNTSDPALDGGNQITPEQWAGLPQGVKDEIEARKGKAWVRGFTYAPENRWASEVRDSCDFTSVDSPAIPAPTTPVATPSNAGGTLAAGTHAYTVTAVNGNGETTSSTQVTGVTSGSLGSVLITWDKVENLTYNVYGRVSGSLGKLATVGPFDEDTAAAYVDTGAASVGAVPPVSNTTGGPGPYGNQALVTYIPYLVVAQDECSTFGFEARDYKGRAQRLLENGTPQAIEKEFWTGALAQAKSFPNNYLANAASYTDLAPTGTPPSVARGMQLLQDALQQCGFGGQGMIHVQAQTAPDMLSVRRNGNLLLDIFDNIVVPGVGYPGTAAAGGGATAGTAVMFATDLVAVRVEEDISVFPDSFAEAVDRGQNGQPNKVSFRAERFAAAYFDAACHFACRVTLKT